MLHGRFGDTTGRPYLDGRLYLPRLNIQGNISFLMDTGADSSILMPTDGIRLSVEYDQLAGDNLVCGIGGSAHCYQERAILVFIEHKILAYAYDLNIDIIQPQNDSSLENCPSLLGRDVLDQWRIIYDPLGSDSGSGRGLHIKVRHADATFNFNE